MRRVATIETRSVVEKPPAVGVPAVHWEAAEEQAAVELDLIDFAEELVVAELPGIDQCEQCHAYAGIATP